MSASTPLLAWLERQPTVGLARLPTPLEPLAGPPLCASVRLWLKRDDLTGSDLSGNKVRKLDHLLAGPARAGAKGVITTGGAQSNHARATALAACRVGLRPFLLLRGRPAPEGAVQGNQLLSALAGAEVRWIDDEQYAGRDALMAAWAEELAARGTPCVVVPEGGSSARGSRGYVRAGFELAAQAARLGVRLDAVVTACGSGGTAAGLLAAHLAAPDLVPRPVAVPVCDDAATFRPRVQAILHALYADAGLDVPAPGVDALTWLDGFVGPGYARTTPDALSALAAEVRQRGLVLDPTYTGKAWAALRHTLEADPARLGREVAFLHTGGLPSLFAWPGTWTAPLRAAAQ